MGKVRYTKLDIFISICQLLQMAQMKDDRHGLVALKGLLGSSFEEGGVSSPLDIVVGLLMQGGDGGLGRGQCIL